MNLAAIPSPDTAVWELGPLPVRAYALCIIAGIVVACAVTEYRLRARGVPKWAVLDIAVWAVPFGIIGARIYHVITTPGDYFGEDGDLVRALRIWEGGLGVWGSVAGGALGAWLGCRQIGVPLTVVADALAPGLPLAQAVGRLGNWFNNELYGGVTTLPWGLEVHEMDPDNPGRALADGDGNPILLPGLYHPTFLYEALWDVGVAVLVFAADRRYKFGKGRAFALYVMGYTAGRAWIEAMRTDQAVEFLGARLNVWTSIVVFLGGLIYFLRVRGPREYLIPASALTPSVPEPAMATAGAPGVGDAPAGDSPDDAPPKGAAPPRYAVVTEAQYLAYVETGEVPADGGDPDDDDGADLVDASMPPLDDFADDPEAASDAEADADPDADDDGDRAADGAGAGARGAGAAAGDSGAEEPARGTPPVEVR